MLVVGGGLHGGLVALALLDAEPALRLALISWPGYRVTFPGFERMVDLPYGCLTSDSLASAVRESFASHQDAVLVAGRTATTLTANTVTRADGRELRASLVIDARGGGKIGACGYQKFLGH